MKRLTTDNPKDNLSTALNLYYVKDRMTMVRGGGPAPDYPDVTLPEYMRRIIKALGVDIQDDGDEDLDEIMAEMLFDGPETLEGVLADLYTSAWAFSEIREKLNEYEDAEADGRLVRLPCKVGDTVYVLTERGFIAKGELRNFRLFDKLVADVEYHHFGTCATSRYWGETVFLTREQAEAALKEKAE